MNGSSRSTVAAPTEKRVTASSCWTSPGSKRRMVMSSRARYGSSGPAAGTTATPPEGSAAIASAFASATRSTVPRSSRCSGPMCGTTTIVGRAIAHSAATWPMPRIPISVTSTSVSGSSRHTVSGRPISLFRLRSAQIVGTCGAQSAPRMSFVVVLPGGPDDGDDLRARLRADERCERGERGLLVVRDERRGAARTRLVDEANARVQRDEQVAGPDLARVRLHRR